MTTTVCDFNATVQPSARSFTVQAEETILNAAIRQGIPLPYSCRDGVCGACKCKLLEGKVQLQSHADQALSPSEISEGYILTCRARVQSDIALEARQVSHEAAFPIRKMPVRVSRMEPLSADVMRLIFQLPAQQNFQYHPGQFVEFVLKDGTRRAYSMATAAQLQTDPPTLELHIRHLPGGKFTDHVFGGMQVRDILRVEGPFGSFHLHQESGNPLLLLATGTGFAPVKAMLEHLQHTADKRPVHLYWGARTQDDLYLHAWLEVFLRTMPQIQYTPVLSQPSAQAHWHGKTGYIQAAMQHDYPDLSGHDVYACGSPKMVEAAKRIATQQCHLPETNFYADAFTSEADKAQLPVAPTTL